MNRQAVEVLFVLPAATGDPGGDGLALLADEHGAVAPGRSRSASDHVRLRRVAGALPSPYDAPVAVGGGQRAGANAGRRPRPPRGTSRGRLRVIGTGDEHGYGGNLLGKIHAYAHRCQRLADRARFDVIHAHDWMTFPAAQGLAQRTGRPMIAHVHATEFDRTGSRVNQPVYDTERAGMHAADLVVTVSHRTRATLLEHYGVPSDKVRVAHNGIEPADAPAPPRPSTPKRHRTVLFLGRLTAQKGPGFFLQAAARVLERVDDVRFIVAGWGDLAPRMVEEVAARGLGDRVLFTGFLRGADVDRAFREADVYVMPSVSEPFGLTALEAMRNGTPVVLSRSSGVAEVIDGTALTVDYWDVDAMARCIVDLLTDTEMAAALRQRGAALLERLTWDETAAKCVSLYRELLAARGAAVG